MQMLPLFIGRLLRLPLEEMLPLMLCRLAPSTDETELCLWRSCPFVLGGLRVDRWTGAVSSVMGKSEGGYSVLFSMDTSARSIYGGSSGGILGPTLMYSR